QLHQRELIEYALDHTFAQGFQQIDVRLGAFVDDGIAQQTVVQYGLDILVVHFLGNVDVELCVDVQRLGSTQFMLQNTNACVQGELAKEDASGGHKGMAL